MKKRLLTLIMGMIFVSLQVIGQERTITGTVTSADDGLPLPGVSVKVKGTTTGTITNADGNYSIRASSNQVLVFSSIGSQTLEVPVGDGGTRNVSLKTESSRLNEVVVTAYGLQRSAASLGYSTTTIKGDEVAQTGRENFINGLAGRVAGLTVNQTSGDPGASSQVILRGFVSISGDNSPLMVVDGVPVDNSVTSQSNTAMGGTNQRQDYTNRASDINPADIESYTILKGPEATALYGNLGMSGAIVITTKKGKAGRGSVSYNSSLRIETVNNAPEVQQVYGQGTIPSVFDGASFTYFGPKYSEGQKIYDNIGSFFETGMAQKHNLVFEGGKEAFTYRWSNEYTDNKGTIPTTQYKRFVTSLTGTAAISSKINLTTRFSYTNAYNKKANKGLQGYVMGLLRFPARYDVNNWSDPLGNRVVTTGTIYNEPDNPLWDVHKNTADDKTHALLANTTLTVKPTKWLNVTAILGTNISNTDGLVVYHKQSFFGSGSSTSPLGGVINTSQALNKRFDGSLTASALHKFGKFNNTYMLGANFSSVNNTINSARGQNMFDPDFYSINNTLPSTQTARLFINRYRNGGVFAQTVLGYQDILYLTLTGRVDAASRLRPNNPYFAYPSASVAFNFSELEAVKNLAWLSYGKLRISYGVTGKEPYQVYALGTRLLPVNSTGGGFTYDLANGGNDKLRPERSYNIETGFELGFFKDRISIDFNTYLLESKGQIVLPRISYASGSALRMMNGGNVTNRGIEVTLKGVPIRKKDFTWDVIFNFSRNRGIINSIAEELPEYYNDNTWLGNGVRGSAFPGQSTMSLGGWINQKNNKGDLLISPSTGLPLLVGGGADFFMIANREPKFKLGYNNYLRYRSFNCSFNLDFRYGGDVYNETQYQLYIRGLSVKTLDREEPRVIKGVLKDGLENTDNPTINNIVITPSTNTSYYTSTTNGVAPEMFVERNIKTLRLRDVTVGYYVPKTFTSKVKFIQAAGIYLTLTDVFLLTNYTGMDPDVNGNNPSVGGVGGNGIDLGSMGRPLGINLGLNIKL